MEDIPDLLDELMAEGMTEDPQFASYVDAAMHRRALLRSFGRRRQALGVLSANTGSAHEDAAAGYNPTGARRE